MATGFTQTDGGIYDSGEIVIDPAPPVSDTTPAPFGWPSQTGWNTGVNATSVEATPVGYNTDTLVSVDVGEFSVGGDNFSATPRNISPGESVTLRHQTSGTAGGSVIQTCTIGGVEGTFQTTTAAAPPVPTGAFFSDGFESGDLGKNENGAFWRGESGDTVVSQTNPKTGSYSVAMTYGPDSVGQDSNCELRFDFGAEYDDVWIKFDLFIPSNYFHRAEPSGGSNNKILRLWSVDYNDSEKVGDSVYSQADGSSQLTIDYRRSDGAGMSTGTGGNVNNFININVDRGKWMEVIVHVKAATDSENLIYQFWKNGAKLLDRSVALNYVPGTQGYQYGYLMGWSNSGFEDATVINIDDVVFSETNLWGVS